MVWLDEATLKKWSGFRVRIWQSNKYTIMLPQAGQSVSAALGYAHAFEVNTIAGGVILIGTI